MEQFLFQYADGEYHDDFQTNDRLEAIEYAREHKLKVERVFYVEADSEIIEDFTGSQD